jgi:large subunit ribosomal protein L17
MLANMAISLITHKRIETTLAKAKALRRYIEPLLTKAKNNTTHSRRVVFSYLQNKEAITELFSSVAKAIGDRPGGYVRVIRTGFRRGDSAEMALIELVDFNPDYSSKEKPEGKGSKRRRTRRGGAKAAAAVATAATATAAVATADTSEEIAAEDVAEEKAADASNEEE